MIMLEDEMATESLVRQDKGNALDTSGLCLLSLDGGGVRGLSSLYVLKNIMWRLNSERQKNGLAAVKPCEIFDLIGGTSTGGLIAIMLGRLEMDIDQCIIAYTELMEKVFSKKKHMLPFSLRGKLQPRFLSEKLKEAVETVIKKQGYSPDDRLNNGAPHGCKVFVCAVAPTVTSAERFRSYEPTLRPSLIEPTILQAALATSAATTFFESVTVNGQLYIDGAIQVNNPIFEVESEAFDIWAPRDRDFKDLVKCIISIGTGKSNIIALEDGLKDFAAALVAIATETEATARVAVDRWRYQLNAGRFFRFNVDQGLQGVGLEEFKKAGLVAQATQRYLTDQTQIEIVTKCVENLKYKQNKAPLELAKLLHDKKDEVCSDKEAGSAIDRDGWFSKEYPQQAFRGVGKSFQREPGNSILLQDTIERIRRATDELQRSQASAEALTNMRTVVPTHRLIEECTAAISQYVRALGEISSLFQGPVALLLQFSSVLPEALDIGESLPSISHIEKTADDKDEVRELLLLFFSDSPWLSRDWGQKFEACLGYNVTTRQRCKYKSPQFRDIAKEKRTVELFREFTAIKTIRSDQAGRLLGLLEEFITLTHCGIHCSIAKKKCIKMWWHMRTEEGAKGLIINNNSSVV